MITTSTPKAKSNKSSTYLWVWLLALLVGVGIRVWVFSVGRNLWFDESMIALNVIHLPFSELLGAHEYNQIAPPGWMLSQKLLYEAFGNAPFSLRILSLIGGIAGLFCFLGLARRALPAGMALLAFTLICINPTLIRFSVELKPYIFDFLIATIILLYCFKVLLKEKNLSTVMPMLAVCGVAAPFISLGSLLVLSSAGLVLFLRSILENNRRDTIMLVILGGLWGLALILAYLLGYSSFFEVLSDRGDTYWNDFFAPLPFSFDGLDWYRKNLGRMSQVFLYGRTDAIIGRSLTLLVVGSLAILGAYYFAKRNIYLLIILITPMIAAIAFSILSIFPLAARVHLALLPSFILLITAGIYQIAEVTLPRFVAIAGAGLILFMPAHTAVYKAMMTPPWMHQEILPQLSIAKELMSPGDVFVLYKTTMPGFLTNGPRVEFDGVNYIKLVEPFKPECGLVNYAMLPEGRNVWFVISNLGYAGFEAHDIWMKKIAETGTIELIGQHPTSRLYKIRIDQKEEVSISCDCYRKDFRLPFERKIGRTINFQKIDATPSICTIDPEL